MPYGTRKTADGKVQVINKRSGHVFGTHASEAAANKQLAALHANAADMESNSSHMSAAMTRKYKRMD